MTIRWALALCTLALSSCATIINSRTVLVQVIADRPMDLVLDQDTFPRHSDTITLILPRAKETVALLLLGDSVERSIALRSKLSPVYWFNTVPYFVPGLAIDRLSPKRFDYPRQIYVDMRPDGHEGYIVYSPRDTAAFAGAGILKTTPSRPFGLVFSGLDLEYEHVIDRHWTLSGGLTHYYAPWYERSYGDRLSGNAFRLEPRYYMRPTAPRRGYLGLSATYAQTERRTSQLFADPEQLELWPDTGLLENYYEGYMDTIGVEGRTFSLALMCGYQWVHNKWAIDVYGGIGIRHQDIVHKGRRNQDDVLHAYHHPNFMHRFIREGRYWTYSLPINVKLGYVF